MSIDATIWAWSASVSKSSERLVLLSLADRADENCLCYPSMERLSNDTLLDIKTVKKVVTDLIDKGFVVDTGDRKGSTQRVRVLRLVGVSKREDKRDQKRNDSKIGMNPILPTNEPKNGTLNEPKIGSQNLSLESNNESKQTNTREDEKNDQAIIDNLTSEPKNFVMPFDWQPNQQEFLGYCMNYGVDPKKLTPDILKKFIGEARANNQKHPESKWCKFLATYLKKWADNPTFEKKPNPHIYQPEQQQPQPQYSDPAYKLFVPLTEEQKRKTPSEELEKMKSLLGGFANE